MNSQLLAQAISKQNCQAQSPAFAVRVGFTAPSKAHDSASSRDTGFCQLPLKTHSHLGCPNWAGGLYTPARGLFILIGNHKR